MQAYADTYLEAKIQTASPGELILLLYEGAIRFSRLAIKWLEQRDIEKSHRYILKIQDIITELNITLDMKSGGDIAKNLRMLYNFINSHLIKANIEKKPCYVKEVLDILMDLYEAWKTIIRQDTVVNNENVNIGVKTMNIAG